MRRMRRIPVLMLSFLFAGSVFSATTSAQVRSNQRVRSSDQVRRLQIRPAQGRAIQSQTTQAQPTQSGATKTRWKPPTTPVMKDEIPESALLTDHGIELASRLRMLRNSEARLRKKHPCFNTVQTEIKSIKRELAAMSAVPTLASETNLSIEQSPLMSNRDLRQLVVQLVGKIDHLEDRIAKLEKPPVDK